MNKKNNIEEKELLQNLREGDEYAFKKIFERYFKILFSYASDFLEKPFLAEDLVEGVFFRLWQRREDIVITGTLSSYLFASVKNACLDYNKAINVRNDYEERIKRKAQLEYNFMFTEITVATSIHEKELKQFIKKAIAELPKDYRKVFKMSRYYRLSNKEIAARMGLSAHTVGKYLNQALLRLKKSLEDILYFLF